MNDYFESIKNKKLALRTYNILIGAVIAWRLGINVLIFNLGAQGLKNLDFKATMANFETTLINDAIVTTIVLTLLMICFASFIPSFFLSMQKILFGWLVGIFVIEGKCYQLIYNIASDKGKLKRKKCIA